jgi:GH15 family glucan-1,4-alpha-glucosidase
MERTLYMIDLVHHSINVIRENQAPGGAYIASPNFPVYRYCWFRDGSFIAYAMDLAGEHDSAQRFHEWASRTILRYESKLSRCVEKAGQGSKPTEGDCFHTRFTLEGMETKDNWPNHQLDGLGTWLWALCQHVKLSGASAQLESWKRALPPVREYLAALWRLPCYDCWEENGDRVHTYTLAAIYGGLQSVAEWFGDRKAADTALEIRSFVLQNMVQDGHLAKFAGSREVDANLLAVATPYRLLKLEDEPMRNTVACIEKELRSGGGGVHRYKRDTYYGGGEWVLLTAWLGWHYVELGQLDRAQAIKAWVEAQATREAELPEQVPLNLNEPSYYPIWAKRWGTIATPLLWSHAKYLILHNALQNRLTGGTPRDP